jgi:hypothetical protein
MADVVRSGAEYRSIRDRRRFEERMVEIDAMLERNGETWRSTVRTRAIGYWELLQTFKLHKGAYDARKGLTGDTPKTFAVSFAAFEREAERRFRYDPVETLESIMPIGDGLADSNLLPHPAPVRPVARPVATGGDGIHVMAPAL